MNREMKHSGLPWAELIPSDWEVERGKHVLTLMQREVREDDEIITCFRDGEVILRRLRREEGFTMSDKEIGYQGINVGDIVIHGMDGFAGAIGISKSQGKGTPVYVVCTTKDNSNNSYIVYYLRTLAQNNVFLALATGIRERSCDLKWNKISVLPFILPPISEQKAIADFLDKKCNEIDELVALQEKMIEELKSYKQSVITETVCKGLNPNVPMKDSGIKWVGDIPEGWSVDRLKSIGKLYGGLSGKSGDDFNVNEEDTYALFIPFTNIFNNNVIDLNKLYKVKVVEGEIQNEVSKGDILFLMSSEDYEGLGKSCLMNDSVPSLYLNSFCKGLRITAENIHSPYINYMLLSTPMRHMIMSMGNGFIRINLRAEKLITLPILLPTFTEQQEIADYLDKKCNGIDQLISIKQQKIVELKDYKKSLIYEYTTGKKEVKL